jgi:hypothetical protein
MNVKYLCAVGILILLFAVPASAEPDAMLDKSRNQFGDLSQNQMNYINSSFDAVVQDILLIPDIYSVITYITGSANDHSFVNNINELDDATDINIVLIHSHGGTSGVSSFITFKDDSRLYDGDVDNWMDQRNGGFFFAGSCSSAKYTDLGNSFIDKGFDTYFGYKGPVRTLRNARFYEAFFDAATFANVEVSTAASYAERRVEDEFESADDVGNNRFIGDSDLCLRT